MGVGTPLERFAAKFCVEPRREWSKIFYGDPFGHIFVPNWVGRGSGASSFTFFLVPGPYWALYQVLIKPYLSLLVLLIEAYWCFFVPIGGVVRACWLRKND